MKDERAGQRDRWSPRGVWKEKCLLAQSQEPQRCRRCDCIVHPRRAYEKNSVVYCCESCAERYECECGCVVFDSG
jgi:hypothetical protein